MIAPSAVSTRLIPAANSNGSEITAKKGTRRVSTPGAGASLPAVLPETRHARVDALGGEGEAHDEREDDRRMAQGEEEADTEGALALLEQSPRRVVDCGDVIGVERVPEAEGVGERAEARQRRIVARVVQKKAPAGEM